MVTTETFRKLALALPDVAESPHFDRASFRFKNKIFATLKTAAKQGMVKLNLNDQSVFCAWQDQTVFYPVPGAWGKGGATFIDLDVVPEPMLADALNCAYQALKAKSKNASS